MQQYTKNQFLNSLCFFVNLSTLGIPGYVHQNGYVKLQNTLMVIKKKKKNPNFIPPSFVGMFERFCKLVILGTLDMLDQGYQKRYYKFEENCDVNVCAKIKFIPHFFLKNSKDIANLLFWVLGVCLVIPTKKLLGNLMFM